MDAASVACFHESPEKLQKFFKTISTAVPRTHGKILSIIERDNADLDSEHRILLTSHMSTFLRILEFRTRNTCRLFEIRFEYII